MKSPDKLHFPHPNGFKEEREHLEAEKEKINK